MRRWSKVATHWVGPAPEHCDLCSRPMSEGGTAWIDGKVQGYSSWANMCEKCWRDYGVGLGTGRGQKYDLETKEKIGG